MLYCIKLPSKLFCIRVLGRHSTTTKLQLIAVEKHNLKCRLKEEEILLLQEMKSYVCYYRKVIASLKEDIYGIYLNSISSPCTYMCVTICTLQ